MQAKTNGKRSGKGAGKDVLTGLVDAAVCEVLDVNPDAYRDFAAMIAKKDSEELLEWVIDMLANEDMPDDVQPKNRHIGWRMMFGVVKAECLRRMA